MRVAVATTGTGTVSLGNALTNFVNLSALTTGSTIGYALDDLSNGAWEVGQGVYTSGSPSTVTRVLESSSTGSLLNLSGNAILMVTQTAVQILSYAPLASPALTGTPTAVTQAYGDNTIDIATDAFVQAAVAPAYADIGSNKIHNPLFNIWQRGTSAVTTSGTYSADRFILQFTGDSNSITQTALADADRSAIGDEEAVFALTNACTGVNSAANFSSINQRIESVRRLSNKTVQVSFYAKASSGTPKVGVSIDQSFGTGGSPSSAVQGNGTAFTLSTTWTRYTGSFTIASVSGKTLGTAGNDFTALNFWYSSGSTNNTRAGSIGVQTATISLYGVQLEIGSNVTQLEKVDPRIDFSNCERFYQLAVAWLGGYGAASQTVGYNVPFHTFMRAAPTTSLSGTAYSNASGAVVLSAAQQGVIVNFTVTSLAAFSALVTVAASADL